MWSTRWKGSGIRDYAKVIYTEQSNARKHYHDDLGRDGQTDENREMAEGMFDRSINYRN